MTEDKPAEIAGNAPEIETPRTVAVVNDDVTVTDNLHLPGELVVNGTLRVTGEVNLMESDSPNGPWTPVPIAPVEHVKGLAKLRDQYPALAQSAHAGDTEARRLLTELAAASDAIIEHILPTDFWEQLQDGPHPGDGFGPPPSTRYIALDQDLADRMAALQRDLAAWKPTSALRGPTPATRPLGEQLRFSSTTIHAAAVRALSQVHEWTDALDGFAYGCQTDQYKGLSIAIGLPDATGARTLWEYLRNGGPRMVKAHYALWARWYEESGDKQADCVQVSINQFCSDLGYTRAVRGGHKRERKQEAMHLLEGLTSVELRAVYTTPTGREMRLRGTLWRRGLLAEERDRYADLFGNVRAGDPDMWDPVAFSFAPGDWFRQPEWHRYNKAIGKIGSGLMHLANNTDEWAILIGGYLGTVIRANVYHPLRLRASTILQATGLAQGKDARRRAAQYREKFERALDRLQKVGVLKSWTWADVDTSEMADPDDPDAVAAYYAEGNLPPGDDWRRQCVALTLPNEQDAARLEVARTKAITKAIEAAERKSKRGRPRKRQAPDG